MLLRFALAFLVVAIITSLFGFGAVQSVAVDTARTLFFIFVVLSALFALANWLSRPHQARRH